CPERRRAVPMVSLLFKENRSNADGSERKYGIKCKNPRLKNGEFVLAVSRHIILDCAATAKTMSLEFSTTIQAVNDAIRKIKDKLAAGLTIPGLSDIEMEKLDSAMKNRNKPKGSARADKQEEKTAWERVQTIAKEHVIIRMFEEGITVGVIAKTVGASKKDVRQAIDKIRGTNQVVREMYQSGQSIPQIARAIGLPEAETRKILKEWGYNLKAVYCPVPEIKKRTISTIKPGKPKNARAAIKRPATIGREGLADWNRLHYDDSGRLRLPCGCAPPADLPRKFPSTKALVLPVKEPAQSFYPAPPPPRAECSSRGRIRIGYMRFF
ncbi:MAG: hypothetical protein K6U74_03250, partial [Firmicutes bacterium]|nr:hypothetical protein [Bacillota bacterium]